MLAFAREDRRSILRDALLIVLFCALASVAFNGLRTDEEGLAWIADKEYDILVPCPEPLEEIDATSATESLELLEARGTLLIDARDEASFGAWHVGPATNIPFDYLAPTSPARIKEILAGGAKRVLVYGDGDAPDSGHELGRELAASGLRNVTYVSGGAPALRRALEPEAGAAPGPAAAPGATAPKGAAP